MFYIKVFPIIEFKNVSYISDTKKNLLKNINLSIYEGDFIAIMGENGCGKTTLAKHMNGLLLPTAGEVLVENLNTKESNNYPRITKTVSLTFQNPDDQFIASTVEEEIAFGLENICYPSEKMQSKIADVLDCVELKEFEKKAVHSLSGGQKQKLALACALALEPKVMVLDEITSMLDPVSQKNVMNIIYCLHKTLKITIILITHNIFEAALAQKIVFMKEGKIQVTDTPESILTDFNLMQKLNIVPMKSTLLLKKLQDIGYKINLKNSLGNISCANEIINILENSNA